MQENKHADGRDGDGGAEPTAPPADKFTTIQALQHLTAEMDKIISSCEQHLQMHPNVARVNTDFTRAKAVKLWMQTKRVQPEANLEAERLNIYDVVFSAICYLRAQADPQRLKALKPTQQNLQVLLSTVQQMGVDIQCGTPIKINPEDMFDIVAAVVVYVYSQGIDTVVDTVYQYVKTETQAADELKKTEFDLALDELGASSQTTTAMDTKSSSSSSDAFGVLRGVSETKQNNGALTEDELMVAEMRKAEKNEIDSNQASMTAARITSDFIPICANTFLQIWLQEAILHEFKCTADIKQMGYDNAELRLENKDDRKRFDEWWQISLIDPTAGFNRMWRDIAYRLWTSPGMALFSRRSALASEEVLPPMSLLQMQYQNERKKSDDLIRASLVRPQDVLKQYKEGMKTHTMLPFLLIGMFAYHFQQQVNKNVTFVDTYMVLPDRLGDMYYKLHAVTNEFGRLRLPLVICLLGKWYILDKGQLLLCADVLGALLTWTRIVMLDKRFNGSTEEGYSIFPWFKQMCLPAEHV